MAAKPKLTPEQWKHARGVWQKDQREGYAWLVKELELPVSGAAVRKVSINEKWKKKPVKQKPSKPVRKIRRASDIADADNVIKVSPKVSKVSPKVSESSKTKVSETMPKTLPETVENTSPGRPTKYREEYADQAYKLCLMGAIDDDLADFFNVTKQTINNWKHDYPEFFDSLKLGKSVADAGMADSLFKSGMGLNVVTEEREMDFGDNVVHKVKVTRQIEPKVNAQIFWLKNRQPSRWRDKVEAAVEFKFDKEELERIKETFIERMRISRERQNQVLIERGLLIEHDEEQKQD